MPYYIRVLGTEDPDIHLDYIVESLTSDGLAAQLAFAEGEQPAKWSLLEVSNKNGDTLFQIERNPVIEGELGSDEIAEFKEEIEEGRPTSAAEWLNVYLDKIKVIYAFQIFNAAFDDENFEIVSSIKYAIWNKTDGILQADNEGFSNEEGYHILWQFSEKVSGEWNCSVMDSSGHWQNFRMDLGDISQRQDFLNGKVPVGAKLI